MTHHDSKDARRLRAPDDLRLVRAALRGDGAASEALASRLRIIPRLLCGINRRRGGQLSDHDLEDLAQDVTILVLRRLEEYLGLGTLDGYAYRFCLHEFMNRVRKAGFREGRTTQTEPPDLPAASSEPEIDAEAVEMALARLAPVDEEILRLKCQEDLSFVELAERLGTPQSTVKGRYYRALQELRARLGPRFEEAL